MNYFTHGRRFVADPCFLAGTAVPDWLNVVDRRVKARAVRAQEFVTDADPRLAAIAKGIIQHHFDDRWFHQTRAFTELSLEFTLAIRDVLSPDDGFRPSFLGHIFVELLLDAALIENGVAQLDAYYAAFDQLNPPEVTAAVERITGRELSLLTRFIPRFSAERFLYDYLDDDKLLTRLNHIMLRVQLQPLPRELRSCFAPARNAVRARQAELLAGESSTANPSPSGFST